jgi:hypothetical protein
MRSHLYASLNYTSIYAPLIITTNNSFQERYLLKVFILLYSINFNKLYRIRGTD